MTRRAAIPVCLATPAPLVISAELYAALTEEARQRAISVQGYVSQVLRLALTEARLSRRFDRGTAR
jgi:hypothetical protein